MSFADDLRELADFIDDHPDLANALQPGCSVRLAIHGWSKKPEARNREMAGLVAFLDGLDEMPEVGRYVDRTAQIGRDFGEHSVYLDVATDMVTPTVPERPVPVPIDIDTIRAWKPDGPEVTVVSDRFAGDAS